MEAALLDELAELGLGHHRFVKADGHGATHGIGHGVMDATPAAQKRLQGGSRTPVQEPTGFEDDFTHWDLLRPLGRSHSDRNARGLQLSPALRQRQEHGIAALDGFLDPVVAHDVGDPDQLHIVLQIDCVGDTLADHAVSLHGHAHCGSSSQGGFQG
jgi:hypothetical protein